MTMTGEQIKEVVTALPRYEELVQAYGELAAIEAERPETPIDINDRDQLNAQKNYIDSRDAIYVPDAEFKARIAEASDAMPLEYRLGMLAVVDRPYKKPSKTELMRNLMNGGVPNVNNDLPMEDILTPPDDPFERAAQVGNAILEIHEQIPNRGRVLGAELSIHRFARENLTRETAVETFTVTKNTFTIQEPIVLAPPHIGAAPSVFYEIPKLKYRSNHGGASYVSLPKVNQLFGQFTDNRKLIFGKEAKSETERIKQENHSYYEQQRKSDLETSQTRVG